MLVSDLINYAILDLAAIVPGETISTAEQTDAFGRLNMIIASASIEQLTLPQMKHEIFAPTAGLPTYTLGTGGTFVSTVRPIRVTGAASVSGTFRQAMEVMSFDKFAATVQDPLASTSVLALKLAADNTYPSINLRMFPVPAAGPGSLWIDYWGAMAQFATVGDTVLLPPETFNWLHFALAAHLYPQYARAGYDPSPLLGLAAAAKGALIKLNQDILGMQEPPQAASQ